MWISQKSTLYTLDSESSIIQELGLIGCLRDKVGGSETLLFFVPLNSLIPVTWTGPSYPSAQMRPEPYTSWVQKHLQVSFMIYLDLPRLHWTLGAPKGRDTYSWQYKGIGNLGVQRAWSEIMNVLANPKGSVGLWNLNFWKLEQFYTNFWSKGVVDTYSKP